MTARSQIQAFFDPDTWTVSYVLWDPASRAAAVIDPVLDYDPHSGRTSTASAQRLLDHLQAHRLSLQWILETHAHADHLSAAHWLRAQAGGRIGIGRHICAVQSTCQKIFNLDASVRADGSQFDHLFDDGERFAIGTLESTALHVPGHTPADLAYVVEDAVFVGDTLFMPDVGTARADFPGGDAHALYRSTRRLLALPPDTRLFVCHDYPPADREPRWQTTVAEQRAHNIHVHDGIDAATFVALRTARDATLGVPTLMLPALQVNVRAGALPPADANGVAYLRIPLNLLAAAPVHDRRQTSSAAP